MKFKALLFGMLGIGLGLTSCNLDNVSDNNYQSGTYSCANLVIPANGDAFATNGSYTAYVYDMDGQIQISTNELNLGYGNIKFTSDKMQGKFTNVKYDNNFYLVTSFSNGTAYDNGVTVSRLNGFITSMVNVLSTNDPLHPDYNFRPMTPLVMSYTLNQDYTVKTFLSDAFYTGTTIVNTVGSEDAPRTVTGIRYRVVFSKDYKKASVFFYEANFGAPMPADKSVNFLLENLDVEFTSNGYKISGQNIIPILYANNGWDPAPNFPFRSFEFTNTSSDLTTGSANFTITAFGTTYSCIFQGFYCLSSTN